MSTKHTGEMPKLFEATNRERSPEYDLLNSLIGKWMTQGETIPTDGTPPLKIQASDIYEWVPGGFFVIHTAYGRIGSQPVGGIEIIGYDPETKKFRTYFYDSRGNLSQQELTFRDGVWTWTGAQARARGELSKNGQAMPTLHEWSDDGKTWRPSMNVTLWKVL